LLRTGGPAAPAGWGDWWQSAELAAQQAIDSVLSSYSSTTEPGVARTLTGLLGAGSTLFVSSSMPIRDVEWFGHPGMTARLLANRGANGIDGVVSTALGVAARSDSTVALVGDLAFLHDSGGLVGAARRGTQLVFVVVDNDGGGIFSFLPQADVLADERFEQLFATPHGLDLAGLAAVHGLPTTRVEASDELGPAVSQAIAAGGVRVVLVTTDRRANREIHDEINAAVVKGVAGFA
jgi:2-succinyl-5-enolpyruvyl-6-hydroxy-3-cyclohexene-1-carboxylate synthase